MGGPAQGFARVFFCKVPDVAMAVARACVFLGFTFFSMAVAQPASSGNFLNPAALTAKLKNNYIPGVNGPVFATPAPGDDMTQSYIDTSKSAVIMGFFFFGLAILIFWMECKTWCKSLTIF